MVIPVWIKGELAITHPATDCLRAEYLLNSYCVGNLIYRDRLFPAARPSLNPHPDGKLGRSLPRDAVVVMEASETGF